ncbi:MAG: tetratricopeptide repeat protein [Elusimicrobiota bacterium]
MKPLGVAALGAALALGAQPAMIRGARSFPPLSELPPTPLSLQDAALASAGLRASAADLAWIQLLQYSAGGIKELTDAPDKPFEHIKPMTERVVRLDPSFHRAYLYGAGVLGWFNNVHRYDEAVDLLREGMRSDPGQPLYSEYIAALAFQKRGDTARMMEILVPAAADPRSPIEMKAILANIYKSQGDYAKALAIWEDMLDNEDDAREWSRARSQIADIRRLMKEKRPR